MVPDRASSTKWSGKGFEGFFKAAKDYLQPILERAAVPLTAALFLSDRLDKPQQAALLVGPVYFVLYLLSAVASRKAHVLVRRHGHEDCTARFLWGVAFAIMLGMVPAMYFRIYWVMIVGFIALYVMQNLWRPVLISRFDAHSEEAWGATVLSIESQAKSAATMLIAPVLGYAVDYVSLLGDPSGGEMWFWPVGVLGLVLTLGFFLTAGRGPEHRNQGGVKGKRRLS